MHAKFFYPQLCAVLPFVAAIAAAAAYHLLWYGLRLLQVRLARFVVVGGVLGGAAGVNGHPAAGAAV